MVEPRAEARDSAAEEILSLSFLRVFARDEALDRADLRAIEEMALRDGVLDSRERAVLTRIFDRIDVDRLDAPLREEIRLFRERYGIR
jgi:CBS domain containing-hemolysin-like protein